MVMRKPKGFHANRSSCRNRHYCFIGKNTYIGTNFEDGADQTFSELTKFFGHLKKIFLSFNICRALRLKGRYKTLNNQGGHGR